MCTANVRKTIRIDLRINLTQTLWFKNSCKTAVNGAERRYFVVRPGVGNLDYLLGQKVFSNAQRIKLPIPDFNHEKCQNYFN